jgi:hypothetical protein
MKSSLSFVSRVRRVLLEQLHRLRETLEYLGQRLRDSIAGEIGRAVAGAVYEGMCALLECESLPSRSSWSRSSSQPLWRDPYERDWPDDRNDPRYEDDWRRDAWDESDDLSTESLSQPASARMMRVLTLVCQTLLWWLKGRSRWPTLGAGLLAGMAACISNPVLSSSCAIAAVVISLIALSDAARSSTAVLAETLSP